nr:2-succinyl-5-enolpyruvyl-6-hydroxy-3-cyclohexene-1-carboxylic-acid synthase [Kytococcus aerolatus]
MNPSGLAARVLVDELVRCGVREAVLCPGSRSAPLAYALAAADADPETQLRLHVRTDERTGAFLALGLAAASGRVVPVVTTSGTAVANLHPAVLEAHHQRVPLLLLTADRPPELRGTGANQTTDQPGIFGQHVRSAVDLGTPSREDEAGQRAEAAGWRTTVDRCWAAATGAAGGDAGPVHLNVPFRDPLVPSAPGRGSAGEQSTAGEQGTAGADGSGPDALAGRAAGAPWTVVPDEARPAGISRVLGDPEQVLELSDGPDRTLVLLGDTGSPARARAAQAGAAARGWPVVAEPFGRFGGDEAVPGGVHLLADETFLAEHAPERVLVVGRLTLHRAAGALLRRPGARVEVVTDAATWPDPGHRAERVHPWRWAGCGADGNAPTPARGDAAPDGHGPSSAWARAWREAGERALQQRGSTSPRSGLTSASTAAVVAEHARGLLFLGSSRAPRSLDLGLGTPGGGVAGIVGNRGLAGIDGCLSTAAGWAFTHGPTTALVGDLTFLHDVNALAVGPDEPRPDLTVVVLSDDGGAIFGDLEYGRPEQLDAFGPDTLRRVFTTPTGARVGQLAAGFGVPCERVTDPDELRAVLAETPAGLRVVEAVLAG